MFYSMLTPKWPLLTPLTPAYTINSSIMTTFKATVRKPRNDGFYSVYIRLVHNRKPGYIKTTKIVAAEQITPTGDVKDPVVNEYCAMLIRQYTDRLNRVDTTYWDVREVIEHLMETDKDVCFSSYARDFISKMQKSGHARTARNYELSVNHLERFVGSTQIYFSQLTSTVLNKWLEELSITNRAKEQYPTCIRQIFKKAFVEMNDEERSIIRIKFNPWLKVKIPKSDTTVKLAISAEACREFFNRPLPASKVTSPLPELGRDVALLSLCLAGMNTVDMYRLKKKDYNNGIISYKRSKTKHFRKDEAYFEIRVVESNSKCKVRESTGRTCPWVCRS